MTVTLLNIPVSVGQWINLYDKSNIDVGIKVSIDNVSDADIYYTSAQEQPEIDFRSYNTLKPRVGKVSNNKGDLGLWALALVEGSEVNVSIFVDEQKETFDNLIDVVTRLFGKAECQSQETIDQLKLLNLRFEEMAKTGINTNDIGK